MTSQAKAPNAELAQEIQGWLRQSDSTTVRGHEYRHYQLLEKAAAALSQPAGEPWAYAVHQPDGAEHDTLIYWCLEDAQDDVDRDDEGDETREIIPLFPLNVPPKPAEPVPEGMVLVSRDFLERCKHSHYSCEDNWYSCPQAEDGCLDERRGPECDCGAKEWNAEIDAMLAAAKEGGK